MPRIDATTIVIVESEVLTRQGLQGRLPTGPEKAEPRAVPAPRGNGGDADEASAHKHPVAQVSARGAMQTGGSTATWGALGAGSGAGPGSASN